VHDEWVWTWLNDFLPEICWLYAALKWNFAKTPVQACDAFAGARAKGRRQRQGWRLGMAFARVETNAKSEPKKCVQLVLSGRVKWVQASRK